jgi:transposase InsO family protein
LLEVAGIARSSYYYHANRFEKPDKYATVKAEIQSIYKGNKGRMGYRRITLELHNRGLRVNHKTVLRLMRQLGLYCQVRMKRYNSYRDEVGTTAPDLLQRDFEAAKPNEKWVTDVTEFHLFGQKLYLSPILDLYNRELVSYSISPSPRFSQTMEMLDQAFQKIPDNTNLILHSDQGWQYRLKPYQRRLEAKGIRQSMSRKGNCLDNAVMENFFGILKTELLYLQTFDSMEHFKRELLDYLHYYNHHRIKQKLKGMSPVQYRIQSLQSA